MPTDIITTIETALVSALQTVLPELKVEAMPNDAKAYERAFAVGAVLVQYMDSEYPAPVTLDLAVQERNARFGILLLVRSLRGQQGAYSYLDTIRKAVFGFTPIAGGNQMIITADAFIEPQENVWAYSLTAAIQMLNTES